MFGFVPKGFFTKYAKGSYSEMVEQIQTHIRRNNPHGVIAALDRLSIPLDAATTVQLVRNAASRCPASLEVLLLHSKIESQPLENHLFIKPNGFGPNTKAVSLLLRTRNMLPTYRK